MRKCIFLTIIASLFFIASSNAQNGQVTGPKAKNSLHWKSAGPKSIVMVKHHNHKPLTGPEAKHNMLWKDDCEVVPIIFLKRDMLTGPEAKNKRHKVNNSYKTVEVLVDNRKK